MSDFFFSARDLAVGYHGVPLIRDIEIRLNRGEILTLIGPNGGGKTTILKSITKYLKTLHGTVYIAEQSINAMHLHDFAKKVSVVLTEKPRTELMTCADVVATGRYPYTGMLGILAKDDKQKVAEALHLVNASHLHDVDFAKVSDGQRQRVLLARAICQEPEIIVLDEPTSFLDVRYELELLGILRRLAKERGIAVIMSLHNLAMAQKVSDYVMCVKGDTIAHYGTPGVIFKRDLIDSLYDLNMGHYNPRFGSVEMARPEGDPNVFVIAGGGTGIPIYRDLQKRQIPFVTGIVHENDVDYEVAQDLASVVISERPFGPITNVTYDAALELLKRCTIVLNRLITYGETNARNKDLYEAALALGLKDESRYEVP